MRGKSHLYHLIHSLTKSEKRYFTLDARKGGKTQSRYLELFQLINKQEVYDEAPLKKKFGTRLGDDKARLYEAILGALREYQSKKSYKIRIKELLTDAKILFERKLYTQSENRLNEAKDLALELQDHLAVLEINLRQRQLMREHQNKDYDEQVEILIKEKNNHLALLDKEFWLTDNLDRLSIKWYQFPSKLKEEEIIVINKEYKDILKIDPNKLMSFIAKWRYYKFMAFYYKLTGLESKALIVFQEIINVWESYPKIKSENFEQYVKEASNLLSVISKTPNQFSSLPQQLDYLKSQKAPSFQGEKLLFIKITNFQLIYLINSPGVAIEKPINSIASKLDHYNIAPNSEFSILSNVVLLVFLNDRFKESLIWIEKIWSLQRKNKKIRKDIQDHSRIIFLMSIYKTSEIEHIENALRTTNRYFNQRKGSKLLHFYTLFASTFKKLQSSYSHKEEVEHLSNLKQEIFKFKNKIHAGLDEICILWIESLIQKKKISKLRKPS